MKKDFTKQFGIEKINKVYHLADIHIRNLKRHTEYREVFDNLYKYIKSTKEYNDIIVVAGDVVHAKTDMTPEVVDLTQEFLTKLANLLPTILIPGNHDANLNNPSRMDALSPIVSALKLTNLLYVKDTTDFKIGNTTFVHKSIWDDSKGFPDSKLIDNEIKIGLYHAPVDKIETELGFVIENKNMNVSDFVGYDMVMLGDIHKPNNPVNGNDHIKYPGSLIVQNHGEAKFPEHGILIWDIQNKTNTFVEIHNDYGYATIDIENGKILGNVTIPAKPRLRVRVKDTKTSELNKILTELKKGKSVQELTIQKVLDKKINGEHEVIQLHNVRDIAFQNKLITDYLEEHYHLTPEQLSVITNINTDVNTKLGTSKQIMNSVWIPKKFEFSNMFSYGPNNVIDFSNMKGAYGIFAPNASGKSTLWDALSFCIFDKCSRTNKAEDVLNYSKMGFDCKFEFELNGTSYYIERIAKKSPKRGTVKVDVDFYTFKDGEKISLNGEQRRDTNLIIRDYVGAYDDFILTAMSTQSNNSGFIDKSQKERKELLAQFLDMDVFEELYQIASEEIKELSVLLKKYKNDDYPTQLADAQTELTQITGSLDTLSNEILTLELSKNELNNKIEYHISTLKPIENVGDVVELETKKQSIIDVINANKIECDNHRVTLENTEKIKLNVESKLKEFNSDELYEKQSQWDTLDKKSKKIQTEISTLETTLKHKKEHLDGIGSLSFDDDCEHCVANKNTPFAKQSEKLKSDIITLQNEILNLKEESVLVSDAKNLVNVQLELKELTELSQHQVDIERRWFRESKVHTDCISYLENLNNNVTELDINIEKAKKQTESVEHNKIVNKIVGELKNDRTNVESEIKDKNLELTQITSNISIINKTIETIQSSIDTLAKTEIKYDGYEHYLQCVKRDGIPYQLISEVLPKLEVEINNILTPIVDFQILLNTDGKNVNSYIAYGDNQFWPLELTSGMEKFISSIAIRTALINVSNLPRPNFIAIDEGFGSLDSDNFNSLYLLFDYLKTQFDFIITISHIDKTRDMVDQIIDINKSKGFSKVSYL